jgi:hypothetical protein
MAHLLDLCDRYLWSILGVVIISITVIACAFPKYQSTSSVFGGFLNRTGWTGYDAALYIWSIVIEFLTGFIFLVILLFS